MNKAKQYWLLIIGVVAVTGITVWMATGDIQRFRETGKDSGIMFTDEKNGHQMHGEMQQVGTQDINGYVMQQDTIMREMMNGMERVTESGNASVDFLVGMIPHHKAAVEMSELYLRSKGINQELKTIAENIIAAQTKEIKEMEGMIQKITSSGDKDKEKETAYLKAYRKMLGTHHQAHAAQAKNVDTAFAEGMIMHHQMAIDMARDILDYTDEESVKELARTIISAQEQEIAHMRKILEAR